MNEQSVQTTPEYVHPVGGGTQDGFTLENEHPVGGVRIDDATLGGVIEH